MTCLWATRRVQGRFLLPVSECEFALESALEDLAVNSFERERGCRMERATGAAMAVAVGLLECCCPSQPARLMVVAGGPATRGPGAVVSLNLEESIRSHQDFEKGNVKHFKKALKFYSGLGNRLMANSHVLDVYACALDQVGLAEMRPAVEATGGMMVMAETTASSNFRTSLQKLLERDADGHLKMAFAATFECFTAREIKVCGAIGPLVSLDQKSASVAETEIGVGNTTAWKLCRSVFAVYDPRRSARPPARPPVAREMYTLVFSGDAGRALGGGSSSSA
jgi:protein transport protein SEC23